MQANNKYITFHWCFFPKQLTITLHSYTVDTATGSNSGLSVLGIEPPTPDWKTDLLNTDPVVPQQV